MKFLKKTVVKENKKLFKEILKIVYPSVIDLFAQTLLAAFDMMMVGSLGAIAISSVGVGSAALNSIVPALMAVGIGTAALLSRAYGANNQEEGKNVLVQSLLIALPLSLMIVTLFLFFSENIVILIARTSDFDLGSAISYQNITTLGIVFLGMNLVFSNAYRAISKTNIPMAANLISLIANVCLNYFFIFILKWGVFGAGLGTTISRFLVTSIFFYLTFFKKNYWIALNIKDIRFNRFISKRIIRIGIPAAIEQLSLRFGMLIFEIMVISLGSISYASHKIASISEAFSFNIGFAFSIAATALVGQALGKNDTELASKNAYASTFLGVCVMSFMGAIFFIAPQIFINLFTKQSEIKPLAESALRIVSICQPFLAVSMVLSGALRGAGATKSVLLVTFIGIFLIRIPSTYFFLYILKTGLLGAWIVMSMDLFIRSIIVFSIFRKGKWKYLVV